MIVLAIFYILYVLFNSLKKKIKEKNIFKKVYRIEDKEFVSFLSCTALFNSLDESEIMQFMPHAFLRTYKKEEVIFFRSDPSQAIYIIKSGTISICIDLKHKFEQVNLLEDNGIFGEDAIISNNCRLYNALCNSEKALVYLIPIYNIYNIFDKNTKIKSIILDNLLSIYNSNINSFLNAYRRSSIGFFSLDNVLSRNS